MVVLLLGNKTFAIVWSQVKRTEQYLDHTLPYAFFIANLGAVRFLS